MDIPSWLVYFTLFLAFIFIYYSLGVRHKQKKPSKLPPGPPRLPIIGNFHQLAGGNFHEMAWKFSEQYGPIMLVYLGPKPYVIISSTEFANEVLRTHDNALLNRPFNKAMKRASYNYMDAAFTSHSEHWRNMRKVLVTEFLGPKRSKLSKRVIDSEINNLLSSLSSGTVVNLDDKLAKYLTNIMTRLAMGKCYTEEMFRGKTFREIVKVLAALLAGSSSDIFPNPIGWFMDELSGWNRRLQTYSSLMDGILDKIIDEHIDHTNEDEKDFIDACKSQLAREELKAVMSNVFFGGTDTTSITMVWGMTEIVKNPRVLQKVQDEIRSSIGKKSQVDESDMENLTYFHMVVKEILRLHAPAPFLFPRECNSHIEIGGYDILPGTRVLVATWAIGRDPRVWTENATEFYPERFEKAVVDQFDMIPFGGGKRNCPGYNLGTSLIKVTILNLLYWFDWKTPHGMNNQDLDMEEEGSLLVSRKNPLCLVPIRHKWQD